MHFERDEWRAQALLEILTDLEGGGYEYRIVGAFIQSDAQSMCGDVDIVIDAFQLQSVSLAVRASCDRLGFTVVAVHAHEHRGVSIYICSTKSGASAEHLALDFYHDCYFRSTLLFRGADLLAAPPEKIDFLGGALCLAAMPENAVYYLHKKLAKGAISSGQFDYLVKIYNPLQCEPILRGLNWQTQEIGQITTLLSEGNFEAFLDAMPSLSSPLEPTWVDRLWSLKRALIRITKREGVLVAVLGPDGVGKTSLIEALMQFERQLFVRVRYEHLRPRIFGGKGAVASTAPHASQPYGDVLSILKIIYFLFDYWVGFLFKTWPELRRTTLIIYDRYFHDIVVDPRRYRYGGPNWLPRLAILLVPKPDLLIILDAPAEEVQRRKAEVPFDETLRQVAKYAELAKIIPYSVTIDATRSSDQVLDQARRFIRRHLSQRALARSERGNL